MIRLHPRLERTQASGFGRGAAPAGAPMRAGAGRVRPDGATVECLTNLGLVAEARRDRGFAPRFAQPRERNGLGSTAAPQYRQPRDNFGAGDPGGRTR